MKLFTINLLLAIAILISHVRLSHANGEIAIENEHIVKPFLFKRIIYYSHTKYIWGFRK